MRVKLILLLLLSCASFCNGQILKGSWTGNYAQNLFGRVSQLVIEFNITKDSIITGKSHLYYPNNDYELHYLEGRFRKKDSTIYFEETLEATSISNAAPVIYYMKLTDEGTQWRLQGFWKWKTAKEEKYLKSNSVWLVKAKPVIAKTTKEKATDKLKEKNTNKPAIAKTRIVPKPQPTTKTTTPARAKPVVISELVTKTNQQVLKSTPEIKTVKPIQEEMPANDARLKKRSEVQKTISVKPEEQDSIDIAIYDNGEIDNDSITVYFNDKLLKQQYRISAVPLTFRISLQSGKANEIKIIAENMGSIPPNTALMIITTKRKRYEVSLSSSLEKNAVVRFLVE